MQINICNGIDVIILFLILVPKTTITELELDKILKTMSLSLQK